jgi:hypothetical protein
MTREEFIAKYGKTFVADDKGGNAASEVAGMDVGNYYDMFLGPDAKSTMTVGGWDNPHEVPIQWGQGRYSDSNPAFDAWSNVDPHPESNRGNGLDEAWKAVGRPLATMAAMYGGINALGGLAGGSDLAFMQNGQVAAANPVAVEGVTGSSFGSGIGGDLLASTPGYESALSGGALGSVDIGSSLMPAASGSGLWDSIKGAGSLLKGNSGLAQLAGAGLGALASGDTQTKASSSKDPWSEAVPYLKDNLKTNANMQEYYRANPFSTEQKTAYQGLLNTLANNQANAPGLLANASAFGQSSRGKMPAMQGLLSGTQAAPIDWAQYTNIGRK